MASLLDEATEVRSAEQQTKTGAQARGYLIALVQDVGCIRAFGSPADEGDCDEILEINGKPVDQSELKHCDIVRHIQECIGRKNISLRVRRNVRYDKLVEDEGNITLLDVFVIGRGPHEQLNRFFKLTNLFSNNQNLFKVSDKMEMLELGTASQQAPTGNGSYDLLNSQNQLQTDHQISINQMNINNAHVYKNHQQQMRFINNQKVSKHRELPVDVPDSFVGIAKQSPRYPPPKPHRQISPQSQANSLTTFSHPTTTKPFSNQHQQPVAPPIAQSTAANIVTHNASLRSSIKLRQLEKSKQQISFTADQLQPSVNQAFEMNEDESISPPDTQQGETTSHKKSIANLQQSMPDLCSIYNRLHKNLNGELTDATNDPKLIKLLSIYNTIVQTRDRQYRLPDLSSRFVTKTNSQGNHEPITYKVIDLLQSVIDLLNGEVMTSDAAELLAILCKHEVDGVCLAFDRIAQSFEFAKASQSNPTIGADTRSKPQHLQHPPRQHQDLGLYPFQQTPINEYDFTSDQVQMDIENNLYQNSLHPLTDIDLSDGICTKTVRIEKNANQPLGATIRNEGCSVVIRRLIYGGAAYNSGLLNEGDELLEVNGINLRGKSINDVINILQGIQDTITFTIISRNFKPTQRQRKEKVFVRTFFSYDSESDDLLPCKELGLSFERGEVLAIIDQSDPQWWQAHRERDSEYRLAGLIPSITFLKEREKESNNEDFTSAYSKREKKNLVSILFNCPKGSSPRRRKKLTVFPYRPEEINYYEEVTTYYSMMYFKRPIILVGPKMIGQREISNRLLKDSNRFASPKSHTSKPMAPHERDGVEFHFISRAQFEADSAAGKFIECGLYQNHYYGTSIEAMKEVVKSKKTCIFLMNTSSFLNFRHGRAGAELKPFFVFVKPDDSHPEKLRNNVASFSPPKSNVEERIKEIIAEVELIETHYLPYFDLVLTISDIERAYQELLHEIDKVEQEPKWIPKFWLETPTSN